MIKKEKHKSLTKSSKNTDRFVVTGALVTILISQIEKGKLGKENGIGPIRIPRSNWDEIEKILDDNIKKLCEKNEIEEINLIG